jgi:hypothetical protein
MTAMDYGGEKTPCYFSIGSFFGSEEKEIDMGEIRAETAGEKLLPLAWA